MNTLNRLQLQAGSPMTAFLTAASILLLAIFASGCSEQSLSPLSSGDASTFSQAPNLTDGEQDRLDVALPKKPASSSDATYRVTFTGDITGGPAEQTSAVKPNSSGVAINPITLNLDYFQTALTGGGSCFSAGEFAGPLQLHIENATANPAQSHFYFWATGSDGVSETKYVLTMNGQFSDPNNWPPAVGTQNTIAMTDWDMAIGASKKNRNIACIGTGTFSSGVTIVVERIS